MYSTATCFTFFFLQISDTASQSNTTLLYYKNWRGDVNDQIQ